MNIHESQAKEIFRKYNIPINQGRIAKTPDETFNAARELFKTGASLVVKAQIHAGARGKGGGVKLVKSPEEARSVAERLLGKNLITPQTGQEGKPVDSVLIEATTGIAREFYAAVVLDRGVAKPCLIISAAGGIEIEQVAHEDPSKIIKKHFSLDSGLDHKIALEAAKSLVSEFKAQESFAAIFEAIAKIFLELDASLVEINPLAIMSDGAVIAIDAKINFDDNALYRHPEITAMHDPRQDDPREVQAKKFDLSYVSLDGNIGCIVNGAGLAMATMDIIKYAGGEPANFLDVGGGASKEKVAAAFKIILTDPKVKAILVNIFGGIMRCDVVAEGILAAVGEVGIKVPLVVRLEGTNVKEGKEILKQSSLNIIAAGSFGEAAEKVTAVL
ncbi:MAG: ADP-forming succinate--CoA ligase subunit beta [Candidatus Omnitrophica bacterium]|nr:ADP-forming succinate--CoA ligase subunit beta [Candidatus Omnitrophota bacterium]